MIISPAEVARSLAYSTHVTSTIVNRLTAEGKIERLGRGKYRFRRALNPAIAGEIYTSIYKGVAENIGLRAIETMTNMKADSFDAKAPVESVAQLVTKLSAWFGKDAVALILRNLEKRLDDESARILLKELKVENKSG